MMTKQELEEFAAEVLGRRFLGEVKVHVCIIDHKIKYAYGPICDIEMWLPIYLQNAPEEVAENIIDCIAVNIIDCIAVKIKKGKKPEYSAAAKAWIDANRSS